MEFASSEQPHVRYNPLKGEWVLVSPHRLQRPWMGQEEGVTSDAGPEFDPNNPLCPGVTRPNGQVTPRYTDTYVFTNDYPALLPNTPAPPESSDPLFVMGEAKGTCKVMCFHPKSNVSIGTMSVHSIILVIDKWIEELTELGKIYKWVQIFENRGEAMGCSNPHPHCQIWASSYLPNEPKIKDSFQREYFEKHKVPLLLDYCRRELESGERVVVKNNNWLVVVPFWASWPYETMILPLTHVRRMYDLNGEQKADLADIMKKMVMKYDSLFNVTFPYSMGWHGAPTGDQSGETMDHWVFHGIYYPPLLRSATIRKFMVGYEMLAQPQRDMTPEKSADILRNVHVPQPKSQIDKKK